MFKIIGIALLILGAAFAIPQTRAKIKPWFSEKLAPIRQRAGVPARKWTAKNEMEALARKFADDITGGKFTPSPKTFTKWLQQNMHAGRRGRDPWNNYYWYVHKGRTVTIGSNGPDGVRDTPDDLRVSQDY